MKNYLPDDFLTQITNFQNSNLLLPEKNKLTETQLNPDILNSYKYIDIPNIEFNPKEGFQQYSKIYKARLDETKPILEKRAQKKWKGIKICPNILDIKSNKMVIIIFYNIFYSKNKL